MNVGALIALLKLAQDAGVTGNGKKATFFDIPPETKQIEDIRPVGDVPTCGPNENLTWIPGSQKYVAAWTVFYALLSKYIARLSKDEWVRWAKSRESDEELIEILEGVIDEIESRMHEMLENFQSSFFGSLGAASKKMDEATGQSTIKAITKDNPIMGLVAEMLMKRSGLEGLIKPQNSDEIGVKQPQKSARLGLK
jgi:hypothetical protein